MKILFSDFDGTLIEHNQTITPRNLEMLETLHQQGHLIVVCTGRNIKEFQAGLEICAVPFDYAVLNNGGHIINRHYETLYEKVIDKTIGIDILNHTTQYKGLWSYFCDGEETYGYKDGYTYDHTLGNKKVDKDFMALYQEARSFQIIAFNQDDEGLYDTLHCFDYIRQHYSDQVEVYLNTYYVDVVPKGCSKGTGMQELLNLIDENIEKVYAIGDSYNDLSMIEEADYGYTFKHADEDIKQTTDLHVNYVYEVIEKMLGGNDDELER